MITLKFSKPIPKKIPTLITKFKGKTEYHYNFFNDDEKLKQCLRELIRRTVK